MRVLADGAQTAVVVQLCHPVLLMSLFSQPASERDEVLEQTSDPFQALFQAIDFLAFDIRHDLRDFLRKLLLLLQLSEKMLEVGLFLVGPDGFKQICEKAGFDSFVDFHKSTRVGQALLPSQNVLQLNLV